MGDKMRCFDKPYAMSLTEGVMLEVHSAQDRPCPKVDIRIVKGGKTVNASAVTLNSPASRSKFAKAVEKAVDHTVTCATVENTLLDVLDRLPAMLAGDAKAPAQGDGDVDVDALWERAKALAEGPDLIERVCTAVAHLGVVNERHNILLIYLAATGRLLDEPINIIIKSNSAAGKSFVLGKVLELLPKSAYVSFTAISPKYLAYTDRDFRHKIVVLYEAAGLVEGEGAYFMRSLLSEGRLHHATVTKDTNGAFGTLEVDKEGPTTLFTSTAHLNLDHELETRALLLATDESPEQSKQINEASARAYSGEEHEGVDVDAFHAFQMWLDVAGEKRVVMPFWQRLAQLVPAKATRVRRDNKALFHLIAASAILHQAQRDRTDKGEIIATIEDYRVVYEPLSSVFTATQDDGLTPEVREAIQAVKDLQETTTSQIMGGVSAPMLAKRLHVVKSTATRRAAAAIKAGYMVNYEWRKGHAAKYYVEEVPEDAPTVLPTPEALAG